MNDPTEYGLVEDLVTREVGADRFTRLERPMTAAEDFSRVLADVPGTFVGLGAVPPDGDPLTAASNHSPQAVFDPAVMPAGASLLARWAIERLRTSPTKETH